MRKILKNIAPILICLIAFLIPFIFREQMWGIVEANQEEPATEIIQRDVEPVPQLESLGEFDLTAYCSCEICCGKWAKNRPKDENGEEIVYTSTGAVAQQGYTVAVDPKVIPYGTMLFFDDNFYCATDCGGAIKEKRIDVYFSNHQEALNFGRKKIEVWRVINEL